MFNSIVFFITAFLGFLCSVIIIGKNKNQEYSLVNKYLVVIIAINTVRFLFHGLSNVSPEVELRKFANILDVSIGLVMPCYYLYLQNIVYENRFRVSNLLHFVVPFLVAITYITTTISSPEYVGFLKKLFFFIGLLFYLIYAALAYVILYKHVWRRKSDINAIQKQNNLIKNWSLFVYFSYLLMFLIRLISGIFSNEPGNYSNSHLWMLALVWLGIFVKLITTPEILYGYNFLNKTIDVATKSVVLSNVWLKESTAMPIASEKDKKLEEKIQSLLTNYLHKIEELSFHTHAFRNPDLSIDDIGIALNIPSSHINYIFKYHCNESFNDYKKIVRIHDATKLLEGGYLNNYKIETLSAEVGFSSYKTFSLAFKNITGLTTQEYAKRF
jgi:AraC-like DNA-binding protein